MAKKIFVGGYYDERLFDGERFAGKTPFDKEVDTYTLEEAMELGFVDIDQVKELWKDKGCDWNTLREEDKIESILYHTEGDEIAGLIYCKTEEEAEALKNKIIEEVEEREKEIIYAGKRQHHNGYNTYYAEVYEHIEDHLKALEGRELTLLELDNIIESLYEENEWQFKGIFEGDTKTYVYDNESYSYPLNDLYDLNISFDIVDDDEDDVCNVVVKIFSVDLI